MHSGTAVIKSIEVDFESDILKSKIKEGKFWGIQVKIPFHRETCKRRHCSQNPIQWAFDCVQLCIGDLCIDHGGLDVIVPQQALYECHVRTILK